ncbi:sensor histidine kinase [Nigerium massiliense]|uniref:sensor histidine kinase n=1 Tax=Nigerium massiliense TaxID=1522317 RepID=UPI00058C6972|nr:ATP-binding protein [Nigerium massiliense]
MIAADAVPERPEALPAVDLTTAGFGRWIDCSVAVFCIVTLLPAIAFASDQLGSLHSVWLAVIGGGLLAVSFLMPLYAWSRRGIGALAALYAAFVLVGLVTWPLAWRPGAELVGTPWLWMCLGLGTVCAALAFTIRAGVFYAAVLSVVLFAVRLTPSGGQVDWSIALQDALLLVVQPATLLFVLALLRQATRELDDSLVQTQNQRMETAVNQALIDERTRLDALVHDEVMTTLVAAARTTERDDTLAEQASLTLERIAASGLGADSTAEVPAAQVVALVTNVVSSVCPKAQVHGEVPDLPVTLPQPSVRVLAQAAREAALNAEKHAQATDVEVEVSIEAVGRRIFLQIDVIDDGVGFDPDEVPGERLGIRVSLHERMKSIGGNANVRSALGQGTAVRLDWAGERSQPAPTPRMKALASPDLHPLLSRMALRPFGLVAAALLVIYLLVGAMSLPLLALPVLGAVTLVLTVIAVGLCLWGSETWQMPDWVAWTIVAVTLAITAMNLLAMPPGGWPGHTSWFANAVMLILIMLMVRDKPVQAWTGAGDYAVIVCIAGILQRPALGDLILVTIMPPAWLAILAFLLWWFDSIAAELESAQFASKEAVEANAAMFSNLVLREVWLSDLQALVGAMLGKIADPEYMLTAEERSQCLLMEGTLRDNIRASNLKSPALSAAIAQARLRGVDITLVDNRGGRLPPAVKRNTLEHLEWLVRGAQGGRIVARTAPEGYKDVVTILRVDPAGQTQLTTIDNNGMIATSTP